MAEKDESYWQEKLTPEQYEVLRLKGTEAPFTGKYLDNHEPGMYACAACGKTLFSSETKFESHSGWPSFYDVEPRKADLPVADQQRRTEATASGKMSRPLAKERANTKGNVELHEDTAHGMKRIEVTCANCGSHLGHLFDDGPADSSTGSESPRAWSRGDKGGKRYCINSACLNFKVKK